MGHIILYKPKESQANNSCLQAAYFSGKNAFTFAAVLYNFIQFINTQEQFV